MDLENLDMTELSEANSSESRYMLAENQYYKRANEKSKRKPLDIQKFKGQLSNIKIENWLKLYERVVKYMEWSEEESILYLSTYLEDDALEWYSSNLDHYDTFSKTKEDLIAQYGIDTSDPLKRALDVKYDFKTGIKPYFNNIKRYTGLAGLDVKNTLSILKQNLPNNIKDFIGGTTISSYSQFYNIVKEAEENIERKRREFEKKRALKFTSFRPNTARPKTGTTQQPTHKSRDKYSTVPPQPCKICAALGYHGRYHEMSDCCNKTPQNTKPNHNEIENDINKIDLN